jgi:hypothetical protein
VVGIGVTVIALALAGCAAPTTGVPVSTPPSSAPAPASATTATNVAATQAFGDAPSVDPCSIVDVAALGATAGTPDSLDSCPIMVKLSDGRQTLVSVGPLEARGQQSTRYVGTLFDGMSLYQEPEPSAGNCTDYIAFTDEYFLAIEAGPADGGEQVCPATDTVAKGVATRIANGAIRHRTFPSGSIGSLDPCGLVPGSVLSSAGMAATPPQEYPEHHECDWFAPASGNQTDGVSLDFIVGTQPTASDPNTDTSTMVAGRPTVLNSGGSTPGCFASAALRPFDAGGPGIFEIAQVVVSMPSGTADQACQAAATIAAAVWPQLPA